MPKVSELRTAGQIAAEELADPEIRREHERAALAHAVAMRVICYRVEHGLSQTGLARLLGMHQPAVARLGAGDHEPSLATLSPAGEDPRRGVPHRHHPRRLRVARQRLSQPQPFWGRNGSRPHPRARTTCAAR